MKSILVFCSLLFVSSSFGSKKMNTEDYSTGKFKVLAVEKPVLECRTFLLGKGEDKSVSPRGCLLTLKRMSKLERGESPLTEFRALGGEGSCEIQKGAVIKEVLNRDCCMKVNFTGCSKTPNEHSTGMWASALNVWYIIDVKNSEKYPIDFVDTVLKQKNEDSKETVPQSIFGRIQDWFIDLF